MDVPLRYRGVVSGGLGKDSGEQQRPQQPTPAPGRERARVAVPYRVHKAGRQAVDESFRGRTSDEARQGRSAREGRKGQEAQSTQRPAARRERMTSVPLPRYGGRQQGGRRVRRSRSGSRRADWPGCSLPPMATATRPKQPITSPEIENAASRTSNRHPDLPGDEHNNDNNNYYNSIIRNHPLTNSQRTDRHPERNRNHWSLARGRASMSR